MLLAFFLFHIANAQQITTIGSGFNQPQGVFVDPNGNILVADTTNNLVKNISVDGSISTFGSGFDRPFGIFQDSTGKVFVSETNTNLVKKISPDGGTVTVIGSGFSGPRGIFVDSAGNVYVADCNNNAIKKVAVDTTISVIGSGFSCPRGVFVDSTGNVFVADSNNNAIKKVSPDGSISVIGSGFNAPKGIFVDSTGTVFVADTNNNAIKKVAPDGSVSLIASSATTFNRPFSLFVDSSGNIYVASLYVTTIVKISTANTGTSVSAQLSSSSSSSLSSSSSSLSSSSSASNSVSQNNPVQNNPSVSSYSTPDAGIASNGQAAAALTGSQASQADFTSQIVLYMTGFFGVVFVVGWSYFFYTRQKNLKNRQQGILMGNDPATTTVNVGWTMYDHNSVNFYANNGGIEQSANINQNAPTRVEEAVETATSLPTSFDTAIAPTSVDTVMSLPSYINNGFEQSFGEKASVSEKHATAIGSTTNATNDKTFLHNGNTLVSDAIESQHVLSLPGHLLTESGEFRLEKKITKGGGGEIFECLPLTENLQERANGQKLVAKKMFSTESTIFIQEVSIMGLFGTHPHFAQMVGFDMKNLIILMIYYQSSFNIWIKKTNPRSLYQIFRVFIGTMDALKDLHEFGIVHYDIKPANILLATTTEGDLDPKLTDFGIANVVDSKVLGVQAFEIRNLRGHSAQYCAPERFKIVPIFREAEKVYKSADSYSMALTLFEALIGKTPWRLDENQ